MDQNIGFSISPLIPNLIPISEVSSESKIKNEYFRFQLPLDMAHCSTTHKRQGVTAKFGAVIKPTDYDRTPFSRGLEYVQLSRATKLEDVFLIGKLNKKHFQSHVAEKNKIVKEYERLKTI